MAHPTIVGAWFWQHRDVRVSMSWNEAFLSSTDSDGDGWLDRHLDTKSYVGSNAWATVHLDGDGWAYQARLIAAPKGSVERSGG